MAENPEMREERERRFHDRAYQEGARAPMHKYYSVVTKSRKYYTRLISANCEGKTVLEYGCGSGSAAFSLAQRGARVIGIDISPIAIEQARETATRLGLDDRSTFLVMSAESLTFADGFFDIVCGTGILHHLDVRNAYREVVRVLKPTGMAVFSEPLGHNFFFNLYRSRTPQFRTEDEHPLLREDLEAAREFFGHIRIRYYHLTSLAAVPFRHLAIFPYLLRFLDGLDDLLFQLPGMRYQAWMNVMVLAKPKKR